METSEIDGRLQRYTAAEHRIGANLHELQQHSVYQLLTTDELSGKTAKALDSLKNATPNLWDLFMMLSNALETARRLRGTGNRIRTEDRLALIDKLTSPSVLLSTDDIPLSERGLTGGSTREERISIEKLIDRMRGQYEPIRDVVTHAEKVLRDVLPRLNSAESTVNRLRTASSALDLVIPELDQIDETIARIRELSLSDPLSIPENARESFDSAIRDASAAVAKARSSHDALSTDIASASELLDSCRDLIEQAKQSRADSLAKVANPIGLRQAPSPNAIDGPGGLADRLEPILNSTQGWQEIRRNLDAWSQTTTRFRDQLQRVVEANSRPLQTRDELRGRLNAFRAKMAALGFAEDIVLSDLSAEAHNELFTSPTDLARAERLVGEFGRRLATA